MNRRTPTKDSKKSRKDLLWDLVEARFNDHPEVFREHLPEIADLMEGAKDKKGRLFRPQLTFRERQARLSSLAPTLERFEREGRLTNEEVVRALEDAAALKEDIPNKEMILKIVIDQWRLGDVQEKKATIAIREDVRKGQTYRLARGIELLLTWDGRLIAIEVDGKELARRQKALSFVGMARDSRPDVAEHHDRYAWEPTE